MISLFETQNLPHLCGIATEFNLLRKRQTSSLSCSAGALAAGHLGRGAQGGRRGADQQAGDGRQSTRRAAVSYRTL